MEANAAPVVFPDDDLFLCDETSSSFKLTVDFEPGYGPLLRQHGGTGMYLARNDVNDWFDEPENRYYEAEVAPNFTEVGIFRIVPGSEPAIEFVPLSAPTGLLGLTHVGTTDRDLSEVRFEGDLVYRKVPVRPQPAAGGQRCAHR